MINTEAGTVALPEWKLQELNQLLAIPATQRCIGRKDMERLKGKICSIKLALPGAVAYLYHVQRTLKQGGGRKGLDIVIISLMNRRLEGTSRSDSGSAHSSGWDYLYKSHPPGVLQRLRHWRRVCVNRSIQIKLKSCVSSPLAARHYCIINLGKESWGDTDQLWPLSCRPFSSWGHPPGCVSWIKHGHALSRIG